MKRDGVWRDRRWRLGVFRRAMAQLSVALVLSALVAGAYQDRLYFTFAASACGVLLLARAWWEYLRWKDPRRRTGKPKIPYILRKVRARRPHKPAFLLSPDDFDDDFTPAVAADTEAFTDRQRLAARVAACLLSAALMIILSFLL